MSKIKNKFKELIKELEQMPDHDIEEAINILHNFINKKKSENN